VDLLERRHGQGRTFEPTECVERGSQVVVGLTVSHPDWPLPGHTFKVFTFRPEDDVVIRIQDCVDRGDALATADAGP
jgi:hypothetical protein